MYVHGNTMKRPSRLSSPHAVVHLPLGLLHLALEVVTNVEVKVARVDLVGLARELACYRLALANSENILNVEDCLLPVGVGELGTCREIHALVRLGKGDVEIHHPRMNVIIAVGSDLERHFEGKILLLNGQDINVLQGSSSRHNLILFHGVDEGLRDSQVLYDTHVKTINTVPPVDLVFFVVGVFDGTQVHGCFIRIDETTRVQPLIPCEQDCVEHRFVQKGIAHPLADDDINFLNWEGNFLNFPSDEGYNISETIDTNNLPGLLNDACTINTDDFRRTSLGGKHAKNASTTTDIKHNLPLEQMLVLEDGAAVAVGPNLVLQHLLVDPEMTIRVEIVVTTSLTGLNGTTTRSFLNFHVVRHSYFAVWLRIGEEFLQQRKPPHVLCVDTT
eukprot:Colp12_sorted_trinity150504_noHs@31065